MPIIWDEPKPRKKRIQSVEVAQEQIRFEEPQKPSNLSELTEYMEEQLRTYQGNQTRIVKRPSDSQLRILITYWQKTHTRSANRTDTIEGQFYQEMQNILDNLP